MKRTTALLTMVFTVLVTLSSFAGDPGQKPEVKLLPADAGMIKVLYVNGHEKNINVKIFGQDGLLIKDKVKLSKGDKGFVKIYNLKELEAGSYRIEISDASMTVSYQVTYQNNQTVWAHYWDGMMPANEGLASN